MNEKQFKKYTIDVINKEMATHGSLWPLFRKTFSKMGIKKSKLEQIVREAING